MGRKLVKIISILMLITLTNDNCYPLAIRPAKERPDVMAELTDEILGARLADLDKRVIPTPFTDEIEAVWFGEKWNKNKDMQVAMTRYRDLLGVKARKLLRSNDIDALKPVARQLRLTNIVLTVIGADIPPGARMAYEDDPNSPIDFRIARMVWADVKGSPWWRPLVYAAVFLGSISLVRCCTHPPKDDGRETVVEFDEKGEYDVAYKWVINGITFLYFPRNSKLLVQEDGLNRKPTQGELEMFHQARLTGGARLSSPITNVVAVGVGNGLNLPFLKEYLEKRGFGKVVIQAIDDGWWMEDKTLPRPNAEMRQEIVELADRTLIGRLQSDEFRIRYVDVFAALPKEFLGHFEVAFLTPGRDRMTTSYVEEVLKLLQPHGILVVRLRTGQSISRDVLEDFCQGNGLTLSIYQESVFPNPDQEFQDLMIVIQRAKFTDKKEWVRSKEFFRRLIGARLSVEIAA